MNTRQHVRRHNIRKERIDTDVSMDVPQSLNIPMVVEEEEEEESRQRAAFVYPFGRIGEGNETFQAQEE